MSKSPDAFRTISEVSATLDTPAHVLRFWESKFSQIKPVKRAGGRRYYRPQDISLLAGIKHLLHVQGMTIKGAQKLLREKGVKHVAGLVDVDITAEAQPDAAPEPAPATKPTPAPMADDANDETIVTFTAMPPPSRPPAAAPAPAAKSAPASPILPLEPATPAEPRIFAALRDANSGALRSRAAEIAPLVARLEAVRDRLRST